MSQPELIEANERFYRAIESRRIGDMETVWSQAVPVACIHPGWRMIRGWPRVRESWERIFEGTPFIQFIVTDVTAQSDGETGWVNCVENIVTVPGGSPDYATVHATNVFRREAGVWRMVVHHASPFVPGS